ncbi:phosphoribosyltransferase family protein [Streptomyces sp. NBC_00525]|uniref:phosphoribosyltransferase family protein n=1 Tax=Streptomyces sp. NBC_00525 TaxID=2903660 RepID=UPI002E81AF00|nr:phosphoribosyltransferase family protein [Streptomyces sp. NBC_00525]WUC96723.1 phosphoribosyltransferase family protein [Streptomyces sp. NBC_00525]
MILEDSYAAARVVDSGRYLTSVNELCDHIPALRPRLLEHVTGRLLAALDLEGCTKILVEEEKGAVIGAAVSLATGIPLAIARTYPYAVPGHRVDFDSEYTRGSLFVNGIEAGDRVCLVDDTLSTGGTLIALVDAVREIGAEVVDAAVVVEKAANGGREALRSRTGLDITSLIRIDVTPDGVSVRDPSAGPRPSRNPDAAGFLRRMRPHTAPGLLVVVEGTDGAGKTTLVNGLSAELRAAGHQVFDTFQPTPSARATEVFRGFAERGGDDPTIHRALYLVTLGDRLYHARATILPRLEAGETVLCDRYIYTTVANALARGQHFDGWFQDTVALLPQPDLALLVHSPVDVAVSRIRQRPEERDRPIDVAHMTRVRTGFLDLVDAGHLTGLDTSVREADETLRTALKAVEAARADRESARGTRA